MSLEKIQAANPGIRIKPVSDPAFLSYGKLVEGYEFGELIRYMSDRTPVPEEENIYIASDEKMEANIIKEKLERELFGEMPVQIGYCNGRNSSLNGLEYHKGSEVAVAVTELVLLLGRVQDITDGHYEAGMAEAFFVPQGAAIELYATTLHFAPCKTTEEGFRCIIILPKGTNLPLQHNSNREGENKLLFARNKWLLVHPSRKVLVEKGAYAGITGENVQIKI